MPESAARIHATCVTIGGRGVLLRGASGAGKSDLALRLIEAGALLVADDQVLLDRAGGALVARAPAALAGLLEVRGVGIVPVPTASSATVALIADLDAAAPIDRLPEPATELLLGVAVRRIAVAPFEASAAAKLRLALAAAGDHMDTPGPPVAAPPPRAAPHPADPAMSAVPPADLPAPVPAPGPVPDRDPLPRLLLVTGMSGAGRSTALRAFEDMGYETVDNLPPQFVEALAQPDPKRDRPLAIGIDVRTRDFGAAPFLATIDALRARSDLACTLLFLDCADEALVRRYSQTRRRHPLALDRPLADGITSERRRLGALRDRADWVIDTTDFNEGDLRRDLRAGFGLALTPGMSMVVMSFAYGQGVPRAADLVFDVRFLRNPHYVEALRPRTGEDDDVGAFVAGDPGFADFYRRLTDFLEPLLPRYRAEGKSYLTIAFGCTGGRHRSVYVAERLAAWLVARGYRAAIRHRELQRDKVAG